MKASSPCRICKGRSKVKCIICGWKVKKSDKPKQKNEITREDRRRDFLGTLYNWMRKCQMKNTGLIGDFYGDTIVVIEVREMDVRIFGDFGEAIAMKSEVTNIRNHKADLEVLKEIGDPLAPDAPLYKPRYKLKKNEV